ncbi:putative F-box domain-containing protein [Helianthus annuus]|nr:putative F-box domain-containing protein [Helianthus annuus]
MGDFLHDDIVCNILARLPAKPLLRFRCVSKHWNRMLREPSFMKLRSRKTIFLPLDQTLHLIDDDNADPVVTRPIPTQYRRGLHRPRVIGTFNGIVVLITLYDIILYNPFTRVSKKLPPKVLIVLDVKDMLLSEMNLPLSFEQPRLLGTVGGCLCALLGCTMWVMKEHNQWSKVYSLPNSFSYNPLCILDTGRILMMIRSPSMNYLVIYDPTKKSRNILNISVQNDNFRNVHVLEYVESLVSPLYIMSHARRSRRKEDKNFKKECSL